MNLSTCRRVARSLTKAFGGVCRYEPGAFELMFREEERLVSLYATERFPLLHDKLVEKKTELDSSDFIYPVVLNGY